jgi:hypothetical protein
LNPRSVEGDQTRPRSELGMSRVTPSHLNTQQIGD